MTSSRQRVNEFRSRFERLELVRREKFDISLPRALRDNGVDVWIHVMKHGNPDALAKDLGAGVDILAPHPSAGSSCYFVFTDRGGDRIERAILGGEVLRGDGGYDLFGGEDDLRAFIEERDPKTIAVNMSGRIAVGDGLSHTGYARLVEALGEKYAGRLISAEQVITDYRDRRVIAEIVEYGRLGEITRRLIERALSSEVITPGRTTLEEVAWWMKDELLGLGVEPIFNKLFMPAILYSAKAESAEYDSPDYVFQRGDLFQFDFGFELMNHGSDIKRTAYVLPEGQIAVPPGLQHAWDEGLRARQVLRDSIKVGRTTGETWEVIGKNFEEAGFVFVNLTDDPAFGGGWDEVWSAALEARGFGPDEEHKTQISTDCHCVGNTGDSEVEAGPCISGFRPAVHHLVLKPNHVFAFELFANTAIPEWGGTRVRLGIEDNAILTEEGVQYFYPPNERILLIH